MVISAGTAIQVVLDSNVSIMGTVTQPTIVGTDNQPTMEYSSEAHVTVTVPSKIPGRADLQITTDMASNMFMFAVGSSRVMPGVPAKFTFTPGSSLMTNQTQPPIPLSVDQLMPMLSLNFPDRSQMMLIIGRLVDDQLQPLANYTTRAFYNDAQISNVSPTGTDGSFTLLIPPLAVANNGVDNITIVMAPPQDLNVTPPANELPQFRSNPVQAKELSLETAVQPHQYTLPAFLPTTAQPPFPFIVMANDQPQAGVTVTFTMSQPVSPDGAAYFQASGVSDASGAVNVPLVLNPATASATYQVMIQGPADSTFGYAFQCIPALTVGLDPSGEPPAPFTFVLTPKVQLSGTISDSMAAPAVGARVTATQTSGVTACGTAATAPKPVQATSGKGGDYNMMVDPGSYQLDVDPPTSPMASWPRVTLSGPDNGVTLTGDMVRNITLPAPQFIEGYVDAPDGTPVPMADVQILEVFCREANCGPTQAPVTLAQVKTDASGTFQAVIPMTLP